MKEVKKLSTFRNATWMQTSKAQDTRGGKYEDIGSTGVNYFTIH